MMPAMAAFRVSPTWGVASMVGTPVAERVDRFQQGHGECVPVVPEVVVVDGQGHNVPLETV